VLFRSYLSVQHATIPYSFYNINSSNNTLYLQEIVVDAYGAQTGVINTYIYLSLGNYNAYQLATYLGTIFPSNRITVAYDNIKNKYTFTNSYNYYTTRRNKSQHLFCLVKSTT
jgi:hypothetical protein